MNHCVTLASKSIPRSGHHLLKEVLKISFGKEFSHCEWYYEPGCCRQLPCKLMESFCQHGQRVRLIKSHDFKLQDSIPNYPDIITIVGYRHPLWSLTSDFIYCLRQQESLRFGISGKMEYLHEPAVVGALTENCHYHLNAWEEGYLRLWLSKQISYQVQFFRKWLHGDSGRLEYFKDRRTINCPYEQLSKPTHAINLVEWVAEDAGLPVPDIAPRLGFIRSTRSPWECSNKHVEEYLGRHCSVFAEAASLIVSQSGLNYEASVDLLKTSMPPHGIKESFLPNTEELAGEAKSPLVRATMLALADENASLRQQCSGLARQAAYASEELSKIRGSLLWSVWTTFRRLFGIPKT